MSRTVSIIVVLLCLLPMLLYFFGQPSWVKQSSFSIDDTDRKELLRYSYFILDSYFNDTDNRSEQLFTLNNQQFYYDRLFITLFTNGKTRGCQSGSTDRNDPNRLFKDVRDATLKSILDDRFDGEIIQEESSNVTIMFTFLYNVRELVNHSLEFLEYYIELGIHSIEIKRGNTSAFFKESVPITNNYDVADTMKRLCVKADFPDDCYLDPSTRIFIYDTFTFYGDRDEKINELYRYDFLIRTDDIDNTLLTERLNLAVDWFKNSVNTATGLLEYEYIPSKNIYSEENNHIRKLATLWAMMKLSNFLETDELDDVIHEMLSYYQDFVTYENNFSTLSINDDANIAYNAFALLSLMEEDQPDNTTDELMEQLAKGILTLQNDDGAYNTS
ncbi:MAG: AMMECR1 domain-containing protein, partial [Candidatus Thermoplasmatota archaeon]|nr:AMMECR1 domain-containing protein [Candidatus Thermoplasmatota archaeon]